ncbi:peptidoglycan-binding protein [Streptomyces sp. NPDC055254]
MRIRPYVTLPDPVEPDEQAPAPPITGAVAPGHDATHGLPHGIPRGGQGPYRGPGPAMPGRQDDTPAYGMPGQGPYRGPGPAMPGRQDDTPAYGMPVPPLRQPWPDAPEAPSRRADTVRLGAVPPGAFPPDPGTTFNGERGEGGGGGGGPEKRSGPPSRRRLLLPLLLGGAATLALGGSALALWVLPGSGDGDTTLLDAKASAPPPSAAPAAPSQTPTAGPTGPSASPSASASTSPSPSASRSGAPSASPSPSASSPPPSQSPSRGPSPSASRAPSSSPSRPAAGPTLRFGDSGAEVEKLQRLLAAEGLYQGKVHGKFDWRVENAVSTFQYEAGIDGEEWGVYGPVTRRALEG